MIKRIEEKMESHVKSILKKDAIDLADYQILCDYLAKEQAKKQAKEWEAKEEERKEHFRDLCETLMK
jgi:hypothetical protein